MVSDPADLVDVELLELAEAVLADNDYSVQRASIEGLEVLLAEDRDSVVVLASLLSPEGTFEVEPKMTNLLASRFERAKGTPKRWDGYVTILASATASGDLGEPLYSLAYNLSRVRRLVRVGVSATRADVQRALAPLLPLSSAEHAMPPTDALRSLEQRLIADGVPEADVSLAMAEFRAQQGRSDPDSSEGPEYDGYISDGRHE